MIFDGLTVGDIVLAFLVFLMLFDFLWVLAVVMVCPCLGFCLFAFFLIGALAKVLQFGLGPRLGYG